MNRLSILAVVLFAVSGCTKSEPVEILVEIDEPIEVAEEEPSSRDKITPKEDDLVSRMELGGEEIILIGDRRVVVAVSDLIVRVAFAQKKFLEEEAAKQKQSEE